MSTSDEEAIRALGAKYCQFLDGTVEAQPLEELLALFSEDATLYSPRQSRLFRGPDELREFFEAVYEGSRGLTKHLTGNVVISLEGETATATSDWIFVRHQTVDGTDQLALASFGRFHDEFIRVSGEWRFQSRRISRGNELPVGA